MQEIAILDDGQPVFALTMRGCPGGRSHAYAQTCGRAQVRSRLSTRRIISDRFSTNPSEREPIISSRICALCTVGDAFLSAFQ